MISIRLGIALDANPGMHASRADIRNRLGWCAEVLDAAQEAGVDSAWFGQGHSAGGGHLPDPLLVIAALARNRTLEMGTGVLLLPAYNLVRLASETALLQHLTDGRLALGIGGGDPGIRARFGLPARPLGRLLDESIPELRRLWAGTPFPPVEPIPILVGGAVAASARRAAVLGDGLYLSTADSRRQIGDLTALYRRHLGDRGRAGGRVLVNRLCVVHQDAERAQQLARTHLLPTLRNYQTSGALEAGPDPTPGDDAGALIDRFCLVGDPDRIADQLTEYVAMGVTDVNLRIAPQGISPDQAAVTVGLLPTVRRLLAARPEC